MDDPRRICSVTCAGRPPCGGAFGRVAGRPDNRRSLVSPVILGGAGRPAPNPGGPGPQLPRFRPPGVRSLVPWSSVDLQAAVAQRRTPAGRGPPRAAGTTPRAGSGRPASTSSTTTSPAGSAPATSSCSPARRAWARRPGRSRSPATSPGRAARSSTSATSTTRQSLLERLVALEAGVVGGIDAPDLRQGPDHLRGAATAGRLGLAERLDEHQRRRRGASTGSSGVRRPPTTCTAPPAGRTTLDVITRDRRGDPRDAPARRRSSSSTTCRRCTCPAARRSRTSGSPVVVEGLKDLALDHDVPVLCRRPPPTRRASPSGNRMRVRHLRGSSALAYEADTRAHAQQQVRRRRPPPPRLRPRQRRAVPALGGAHASRRTAAASTGSTWSSAKRFDQSAGSSRTASWSPSSSSTSGSSPSRRRWPGCRLPLYGVSRRVTASPLREEAVDAPQPSSVACRSSSGLSARPRPRRCGCGSGRPGCRGPWSWRA